MRSTYVRPQISTHRSLFGRIPLVFRIAVVTVFVLTFSAIGFFFISSATVASSHTGCTVVDKDRTSDGDGGSDMRIYTKGCDDKAGDKVFQVADNLFVGEYASADTYASITVGKTYDFETRGMRIPFLSQFENIVGVKAK